MVCVVCEILKALDNVRIIPSTFLVVGGRIILMKKLEELIKYFRDTNLNADSKIEDEIDKITIEWADFEMEWDIYE